MRKAETPQGIVKRLQGSTSPQVTFDASSKIMENITFLNRNCKFLSYVEKEKLVSLLKAQDVEAESLISSVRDNNVSKEEMKSAFYAFLYPKQVSKKPNAQQSTYQRGDSFSKKKNVPVTAVSLSDMLQAHKESKNSTKTSSGRAQEPEYAGGATKASKGISSQEAHEKLQKLTQRSQGGYFDSSSNIRGKSIEAGRGNYHSDNKKQGRELVGNLGKLPVTSLRGAGTPNYSARGNSSNAGRSGDKRTQGLTVNPGNLGLSTIHSGYGESEFEGTSPDFLLSLGLKPAKDITSPPGSSSQRGSTPSITQGKGDNSNIKVFNSRDQIFATQVSLVNKGDSTQDNKGKSGEKRYIGEIDYGSRSVIDYSKMV